MEVWQCLEILRKSEKTWFFEKEKNQEGKLIALNKISEIGYPSLIDNLIPFIKNQSKEIRIGTIQTIKVLFEKIKGKKAYYDSLKHCPISKNDIAYFETEFNKEDLSLLMKISSLNRNGYVREKAVLKLGELETENVLSFIIFRLADWVPNVRNAAKQELRKFIKSENHQELINNLSLFKWLQKVERADLSKTYKEVIEFLVIDSRAETIKSFQDINDKERRILAKELSERIQAEDELNILINDKHFLIRLLSLNHSDRLTDNQKKKLLSDKSARVRQKALYEYRGDKDFESLLKTYLADKSGSIRHLARFYLKEAGIDFKEFYINNLTNNRQVIGSMLGLLDIEAKDCESYLRPQLQSDKVRCVKTAFYVLSNLSPSEVLEFAKSNLFTERIGLRNQVIEYFGKNRNKDILKIVRDKYSNADEEIKLSILKLFSRIGGYSSFPDLLIGTIDKSELVRKQARLYVQKWKSEAISMFSKPTIDEQEKAIKVFNFVNEAHNEKKYFNNNPVEGLDFYIK